MVWGGIGVDGASRLPRGKVGPPPMEGRVGNDTWGAGAGAARVL